MRKTTLPWPLLALLMLVPLTLAAQTLPGGSAFSISRNSTDGIQISFQLPDWHLETVQRGGEAVGSVRVDGIPNLFIGEEETLPVFSAMVAIPYTGGVSLRFADGSVPLRESVRLDFESALAAQQNEGKSGGSLYPAASAQISEPMVLRDLRVVTLNVHPFQYDRAKGELIVRENITISLDFDSSASVNEMEPPLSYSPAFAKIYEGLVLNRTQFMGREDPVYARPRLLVIYGNYSDVPYQTQVGNYVSWKRQKGYLVTAVSTATAGTSFSAIKNYISGQYNNLSTRPDYVVLIGDAGSGSMPVPTNGSYRDYDYTLLAGNDNLGDVAIGRISVNTTEQMVNYMAKIESLEKNLNLNTASWLDRMVLVGDSSASGISTVYTNEFIHDASQEVNPDYSYTELYGGSPSPSAINTAINSGVVFYNYRGYIGMSGWPSYISQLDNSYKLFHAVIITCGTGDFNGTTGTTETVVRQGTSAELGGAVTAIGMATTSTHTPMNNCLDIGIFHGVYPLGMRNMSEPLLYGKLYLYAVYGISNSAQAYNFSGFCNLIGDPTAPVYVGIPNSFQVTAPASIPNGTGGMEVKVLEANSQPVAGASVVLSNSAGQQALAFTDASGWAFLEFSTSLSGSLTLTVNKDDFKPAVSTVSILSGGGLVYDGAEIIDEVGGNGDGQANAGETLDLYFSLLNTTNTALAPAGDVSCSDPYVRLIQYERIEFNNITPGSSGQSQNPVSLAIEGDCPDQHLFVLNFLAVTTSGNWNVPIPVMVSNGHLQIAGHTFVGSPGNLINPGDTWPLTISLTNSGSAALSGLSGTLTSLDNFFEVTDAQGYWGNIATGATVANATNTFIVHPRSSCLDGMVIPLQLDLVNAQGYAQSLPLTFTIGQTSVTDPLGQDAYGYFIFDLGDTGYDQCPSYDWIGIAPAEGGSGTALSLTDPGSSHDEGDQLGAISIRTVTLPFPFTFYGLEYTQASISSNGFIAFGETSDSDWRNWRLPDAGGPSPMVAVFWDDLQLGTGSAVYTWYNPTLHYYVVEWYNLISGYNQSSPETFQAIIYDPIYYPTHTGDGQIKLQYKIFNNIDLGDGDTFPHGNYCTIGIEDHSGTVGLEYTYGNVYPTAAAPLGNETALFITTRPLIPDYPYVVLEQVEVLDPNSNNHLEPGESAQLALRLGNRGLVDATGVSATISSADPYLTINTPGATYGTVPAQGSAWPLANFAVSVASNCPGGHQISFTLEITSATADWTYGFTLGVFVPELGFEGFTVIDDGGNQNGILDPGESATLTLNISNIGEIPAPAGTVTLSCTTPGITITEGTDSFGALVPDASAALVFGINASSAITQGTLVPLVFNALAGSTTTSHTQNLEVGAPLEIIIGSGSGSQSYPLDRYYNFSTHEAIYLASEIAHAGTLKALAFPKTSGSDLNPIENVSIYMKHTLANSLSSGSYSLTGYSLVYSGSFPNNASSGWMEVDLDPRFTYDGISNLSILTLKGYQGWTDGFPQWAFTSTGSNRARQDRSDYGQPSNLSATNSLPNLRLKMFPEYDLLLPPLNLTATAGNQKVTLAWESPASGVPDSYRIYRDGSLLTSLSGLSYVDTQVVNDVTYQYHLTAVYAGEESPSTDTVSATPSLNLYVNLGSGTAVTGGNQNSPLNISNNSVHGQSVYTAAELNAAGVFGPVEITGLGFNVITPPSLPLPNFLVRLKHTTAANSSSWHDASGLQTCYTNASLMPVAGGFHMLMFQTPFIWNGTDNILVDTAFGMVATASQTGTLQFTSAAGGYCFVWSNTSNQTNVFSGGTVVGRRYNVRLAYQEASAIPDIAISLSGANRVLTWEAVPSAGSYKVWTSADPFGDFVLLATVTSGTTYTDTRVNLDRAFYRVTALPLTRTTAN